MNKYTYLKQNEEVMQIFMGPDALPHLFRLTVITSDENSLVLIPIGEASEFSGKIITYDDKTGIPRTYRLSETNLMFTEYLANQQGWELGKTMMQSPKALATEIATLKKIHDLWKATLRENTAASEEKPKQDTFLK